MSLNFAAQKLDEFINPKDGERAQSWDRQTLDGLRTLIRTEVVPAIAEVWGRQSFQHLATYHLRTFLCEGSTERQLLDDFVRRAGSMVSELQELLGSRREEIVTLIGEGPAEAGTLEIEYRNDDRHSLSDRTATYRDLLGVLGSADERLCQSLVRTNDFFREADREDAEYVLDSVGISLGEPFLRDLGNSVLRCMLLRLKVVLESLREVERTITKLANRGQLHIDWTRFPNVVELNELYQAIEYAAIASPEARLSEAAAILIQIVIGLSAKLPDLSWLSVAEVETERQNKLLPNLLRPKNSPAIASYLLEALRKINGFVSSQLPEEAAIESAIAAGNLVILPGHGCVYWAGSEMLGLSANQFAMLRILAEKRRRAATGYDLGFVGKTHKAIYSARCRLGKLLPDDLDILIEAVKDLGEPAYRLSFCPSRVHISY